MEQWTHKPLDVGSNPTLATIHLNCQLCLGLPKKLARANPTLATNYLICQESLGLPKKLAQANPTLATIYLT